MVDWTVYIYVYIYIIYVYIQVLSQGIILSKRLLVLKVGARLFRPSVLTKNDSPIEILSRHQSELQEKYPPGDFCFVE